MRTTEVLLVDDNPADTDLTSEILARNGCPSRIHAVTDARRRSRFCAARESMPMNFFPTS
jgi:CheY-like chemotaxis protein